MSITTKKGDKGLTYLYSGKKVSKDDPRIEACGALDELCSFLGLSRSLIKERNSKKLIETIQRDLFIIGAELSAGPSFCSRLKKRINDGYVDSLESIIGDLENKKTFKANCFFLPGANPVSGTLDIARTIARRAERLVVTLKRKGKLHNDSILIYLNRLSDLLYLLARASGKNQRLSAI